MNLFGNDITHIQLFLSTFADPVFAPAQLVCALALIYRQIGLSMFVGLLIVAGNHMLSLSQLNPYDDQTTPTLS